MDEPTILRTTKIGGGFVKEDVEKYIRELKSQIDSLKQQLQEIMSAEYYDTFMNKFDIDEVLNDDYLKNNVRVRRFGGGYHKEDVMLYIDRINAIISIFTEKIESSIKPVRNNSFLL